MSSGAQPKRLSIGEPEAGDEQAGQWPREVLERMDAKFCARMQQAIARGEERPHGDWPILRRAG